MADRFPGTPWGEEALLALANHYQKDALDDAALPWWRRLVAEYPQGRYVERAAWRVGWADYRAGRYEAAALLLETTARLRPPSGSTAGFLYWSARARVAMGQSDRARLLLAETVQRYKHAYHGVRASEALARLGGIPAPPAVLVADRPAPGGASPRAARRPASASCSSSTGSPRRSRSCGCCPSRRACRRRSPGSTGGRGRYRPAIVAMKRAYPEWVGEAGDRLPAEVWRILFPLRYDAELRLAAQQEGVDPALVAALILQESSFDAGGAQPGGGARPHAGDARHRPEDRAGQGRSASAAPPSTTRRRASTSAPTTCAR